ncbi:MAG: hypothetical protein M5U09_20000 [Gammaproteobacteria bacterium]|nr:hypothetical protein [Gammaproteobacteria bacterium]
MNDREDAQTRPAEQSADADVDVLRREALAKLGRLSGVTSVTLLTLVLSDKASAQSAGLGLPPPPPPP